MNAAWSLESSVTWVGTMLLTPELHDRVARALLCRSINEITQKPYSALVLFVFHIVRAFVSYLIETTFQYFFALSLVGLRRLLLLSNPRTSRTCELSGIDSFRWQYSGHCILTLVVFVIMRYELNSTHASTNRLSAKWYLLRFSQSCVPKTRINRWWYHLFFITRP